MSSKFVQIRPRTAELAALERLENTHRLIMRNVVATLGLSYLIGSSPFLQVKVWMSSNFRPDDYGSIRCPLASNISMYPLLLGCF